MKPSRTGDRNALSSANTIRRVKLTYPANSRSVLLEYGASGSMPDALSRLDSIGDFVGSTSLASFSYLGLDTHGAVELPAAERDDDVDRHAR